MINSISTNLQRDGIVNSPKTYSSLNEFSSSLIKYGENQTKIYENKFKNDENGGKSSVDKLKEEIQKEFSKYKFVSSEPSDPINGQHLLYIDDKNLQKMANDPSYKAKVFGLMRREHDSLDTNHKIRMGSDVISSNITGSVFSLSDKNENVGGVPYKGMAMSAPSFSDNSSSFVIKNTNTFGSKDDWFEELLKKIKEKKDEEKRIEFQKEKNEILNIKI